MQNSNSQDPTGLMERVLLAIGKLQAHTEGNRQAMLQRTGDMMEYFHRLLEAQAIRFDERTKWLATEVFQDLKQAREREQAIEQRVRMVEVEVKIGSATSGKLSWRQAIMVLIKEIGVRQVTGMIMAFILTSLGIWTAPQLAAYVRTQFGL